MEDQSLTSFVAQHGGGSYFKVQDDLGDGFVRLRAAEAQRRQAKQDIRSFEDVVIEMLRNARDAGAQAIFIATWTEGTLRRLTMIDDGCGIPETMHETVFEPFVTSKLDTFHDDRWGAHGRGMALYSIRQNVDDARIVASAPGLGSVFAATSDTTRLTEKRDQSSLPVIARDKDGSISLRGPHNIARTVMEFAIDERGRCAVYLGSPAEIVATLHRLGADATLRLSSLLKLDEDELPFYQRLAFAFDADDLAAAADTLGLPISTRTAHRILKGEVEALKTHLELLAPPAKRTSQRGSHAPESRSRGAAVRLDAYEVSDFCDRVANAFEPLAHSHYLEPSVEVKAHVRGGELVVRIPLERLE